MIATYPRQWILIPSSASTPLGSRVEHDDYGWKLCVNCDTFVGKAIDRCRQVVLVGVAVDVVRPLESMSQISARLAEVTPGEYLPSLVDLVGCYVLFVWEASRVFVYTDPAASCGVYLTRTQARLASTPSLLGELNVRHELKGWFGSRPHNCWIPGHLTLYEGIEVLPANHRLTLPEWTVERFWPEEGKFDSAANHDPSADIAFDLRAALEAVTRDSRRTMLSLTGGYDSRVNLAAARGVVSSVMLFTLRSSGVKKPDIEIAQRVANRAGVTLQIIDCPAPEPTLLEDFDRVCARQAIGSVREVVGGCAKLAGVPSIHINGGLGVLLKNYYAASLGPRSRPIRIRELLTDFESPPRMVIDGVERWLESVAGLPPQLQRTLMYLEQRAARWMGPTELGSSAFFDSFSPFTSRRVVVKAAFASDALLEGGRLHKRVIAHLWPELLEIPFVRGRGPLIRMIPRGMKERLRRIKWLARIRQSGRDLGLR